MRGSVGIYVFVIVSAAYCDVLYSLSVVEPPTISVTDIAALIVRIIAIFNNTAEALTFEKKWYNRGREGENYAAQRSSKIDLRSIRQRC